MIKIGRIGLDLQDNKKELSISNKATKIYLLNICICGHEIELTPEMFSDDCKCGCGWKYKCKCGNVNNIWEGAFDNYIENLYDNDLIVDEEEEN